MELNNVNKANNKEKSSWCPSHCPVATTGIDGFPLPFSLIEKMRICTAFCANQLASMNFIVEFINLLNAINDFDELLSAYLRQVTTYFQPDKALIYRENIAGDKKELIAGSREKIQPVALPSGCSLPSSPTFWQTATIDYFFPHLGGSFHYAACLPLFT